MTERPMFQMNDYGDIWVEPELFDDAIATELAHAVDDFLEDADDDISYSDATGDYGQWD